MQAIRRFQRAHDHRHPDLPLVLRGDIHVTSTTDAFELTRMIWYVHKNPIEPKPRLVEEPVHFEWSSARAFADLSRAPFPNVARARALADRSAWRLRDRLDVPALAGLEPVAAPSASPWTILAASAQVFGLTAEQVASTRRHGSFAAARAVYAHVGRLESYTCQQLAIYLGCNRQRASQLATGPVDLHAVRIARTLFRTPAFRARLRAPASAQAFATR